MFPMKYFGILNGRIVYACEVQVVKMTGSHISPQSIGLQEYDCNQLPIILNHIFAVIRYLFFCSEQ